MVIRSKGEVWTEGDDIYIALQDVKFDDNLAKDNEEYLYREWVDKIFVWDGLQYPTRKEVLDLLERFK